MTDEQIKQRCPYELHVEEFFGLSKKVKEKDEIKTDFGMLVNLVATWDGKNKDAPKWVKVSEIKPPNGERVLILKRTGHTMIATYYVVDQFNRPDMFVGEGGAHYDITWVDYWMNIPKPPINGGNQ